MSELFNDLANRSEGATIDRITFLQFFNLPVILTQGLLGERLFELFDTKNTGLIDFEEFVEGLEKSCRTEADGKCKLLFYLYDLKSDGFIDKSELVAMIHNCLDQTKAIVSSPKKRPLDIDLKTPQKDLSSQSTSFIEEVEGFAETVLQNYGGQLGFEEFKLFLEDYPQMMELFDSAFNEKMWSFGECSPKKSKMICGADTIDLSPIIQNPEHKGYLYRSFDTSSKMHKKFAVLQERVLMLLHSPQDAFPESIVFLEGCYVDTENSAGKYALLLSHNYENYKNFKLWCDSEAERAIWVKKIEAAARIKKFRDHYKLKNNIGHGKFSDVFKAKERTTKSTWAVKSITKTNLRTEEKELIRSEIAIMRVLKHPGVIRLKEVFETKNQIFIVMELAEDGELYELVCKHRVFSEAEAFGIIKQLLETVKYLHEIGIVHRDLKPENILVNTSSGTPAIKVADFGLSKLVSPNDSLKLACGTLAYVAPEVLQGTGYNQKADLWSLGVISYLL